MVEINSRKDAGHQSQHRSTQLERIGVWEWDLVNDSVYYSPDWKRLRGCDAKDALTPDLATQFVHPDDQAKRKKLHARLLAGELEQIQFEHRVKRSDGSWGQVVERIHAICNNDGQPIRLVGCEVDVSAEEQEQQLQEGSKPCAPQVDSLPVAIARFESNQCVYVNEGWSRLTGRSKESALGDGWLESLHPDDRGKSMEFMALHREGRPGDQVVVDGIDGRHLNPDGSINWFVTNVQLNYGMDGILASSSVVVLDVTDRKKLERQQECLIEIAEATPDFIGMATPDRKVLWLNKRLSEFRSDLKPDENTDVTVFHPDWSNKIMREVGFPAAIEHGSWSGKMAILDLDGNEIPVSQVLIAHKGPDGSVEAFSTIMRDIGEQEKTEIALRLSERNYASLAATAPVGIFRMSDPTNCIYVNENWSKQTGHPLEAALGQGWMEFVHPDDLEILLEKSAAFATDPKQIVQDAAEARQVLPDGSTHWVQCHLAKELDDEGNVTGYVGTLSDIDRVKRAEEELKELNRRLHHVLEFSSIGIWEWSWEDEQLAWDEKMLEIYGVDAGDFSGRQSDWSDRLHPDDRERILAEDKFRIESNSFDQPFAQEFRIVRPCGEVRHIYSSVHSEIDEHGKPVRTSGVNVDITERREAEFALLESENKLKLIADHLPGIVDRYFLDSDGNHGFKYVSSQVREIFGFEPDQLIANPELLWQYVEPSDSDRLIEKMHDSASSLSPYVEELRITMPGRGTRWFQVSSKPKKVENDGVVWDGVVLEITDRKTAEIELQDAKLQMERIAENVPGMIYRYLFQKEGGHIAKFISSKSLDMFGIESDKALEDASRLLKWLHPEDVGPLTESVLSSVRNLEPLAAEYRVTLPNEGTRWYQSSGQPEKLENGDITLDGVVLDITDRKEVELALEDAMLQKERITENVPGMIYQYVQQPDGTHAVSFISSQCRDLFELAPEEVMDDVELFFEAMHPEDAEKVRETFASSARTLQPLKVEYRVLLSGKRVRWLQSIGRPFRTGNEGTVWNGMVLDITDRKEAELANDTLAKATKTKDQFLANMSHELRTPLTAILAMTDGLQQGMFGETTPKQMESLKIVEQSGVHLLDLINEVLDLAKMQSGQTELEFSYVNVSELCESCLNFVTQQAEQKQIELSLKVPWNLPKFGADEKRIRQVLINLLSNAVEFTPERGQVKLEIETLVAETTDLASETLRISVSDTGIGIKADKLDSLFEPFVQVDSSLTRHQGGTGLGLSLVKQFVELHQGTIRVSSEPGRGSCFAVDLPFRKMGTEQSDRSNDREQRRASETSEAASMINSPELPVGDGDDQPLIILVEDNDLVAQSIIPILEYYSFRVLRAVNGKFAVEMAREHSPDLILMDVQMPQMDGLEATRQIRAIAKLSEVPIIALSGFAKSEDSQRCIESGVDLFMSKPLRSKELVGNINRLLNERKTTDRSE